MRQVKPRQKILEHIKATGQSWAFCGNVSILSRPYLAACCPWCDESNNLQIWKFADYLPTYHLVDFQAILFKCSNGVVQAFWIGECDHCHGLSWAFQKDTIKPRKHVVF